MPAKPASSHPSRRTQTPPELKWLLNERAALAGRLAGLHQAAAKQRLLVLAAEARLAKRLATLAELERTAAGTLAKMDALGATISLGYPEVSPDSAGTVRAHTRFGQRGALTSFLLHAVTEAGTEGLATARLTDLVRDAFRVPTSNRAERRSLLSTVRNRLKELRDIHQLVVGARGPAAISDTVWRLRPSSPLQGLSQLKALAAAAEAADERVAQPNAP
ncbi:MAG: hypothetical protein U1F53_01290 [Burkholderiaceae bacterium]